MVKVKVNVTKRDIYNGLPGSCLNCPVALATLRSFPTVAQVLVDGYSILAHGEWIARRVPSACTDFISDFDELKKVRPFSFVVKITNKLAKQLNPSKRYIVA